MKPTCRLYLVSCYGDTSKLAAMFTLHVLTHECPLLSLAHLTWFLYRALALVILVVGWLR
jgi:hypothetical protein